MWPEEAHFSSDPEAGSVYQPASLWFRDWSEALYTAWLADKALGPRNPIVQVAIAEMFASGEGDTPVGGYHLSREPARQVCRLFELAAHDELPNVPRELVDWAAEVYKNPTGPDLGLPVQFLGTV